MSALLEVRGLRAGYGQVEVLRGVDLDVNAGEIVVLLGSNGAGKSTLNNTVSGLCKAWAGTVSFDGRPLTGSHYRKAVQAGLIQAPEVLGVFPTLCASQNPHLGSFARARAHGAANLAKARDIFPRLRERRTQLAGTMSGGAQQMLAT